MAEVQEENSRNVEAIHAKETISRELERLTQKLKEKEARLDEALEREVQIDAQLVQVLLLSDTDENDSRKNERDKRKRIFSLSDLPKRRRHVRSKRPSVHYQEKGCKTAPNFL